MDTQLQKKYKVLLLGDNCTDEYQYGSVDRISPEAPVPIINYIYSESKPGMVGNVRINLINLGLDIHMLASEPGTKTRIIDIKSGQQLLRIDRDKHSKPLEIESLSDLNLALFDSIVISDYNKGYITYDIIRHLRRHYTGPIFLDTKKQELDKFYGIYVKINEFEYKSIKSINDQLIVTLGSKGAMLKRYSDEQFFTVPKIEVTDVCGAGDTFLSSLTYKFLQSGSITTAINFANRAATIMVQHMGNYAPRLEEII